MDHKRVFTLKVTIPIFAFLTVIAQFGCTKAYVDPNLPRVSYSELEQVQKPPSLKVSFQFQTNGKYNKAATKQVSTLVVKTLKDSKLFASVDLVKKPEKSNLDIVMNNVGDTSSAVRKGVATGCTLGIAGSQVTDGYVFTSTYLAPDKEPVILQYEHAIHTTIGAKKGPEGLKPVTLKKAIEDVTEQLVLNTLKDLQAGGYL